VPRQKSTWTKRLMVLRLTSKPKSATSPST
jgi:hypothetical protein